MQILLDVEDGIDANEIVNLLRIQYPNKKITPILQTFKKECKKFEGIDDLKPLMVENFVMYPRESLYER